MAVPGVREKIVIIKQPSNRVRTTAVTWVRKSSEGKVWLTKCRIKGRLMDHTPGNPTEYLCQMVDADLMDEIWQTIFRTRSFNEAINWLYQR